MRAALATQTRPDELDLYETLAVEGGTIVAAGNTIRLFRGYGIEDDARRRARAAAQRIISAIDAYEAAQEHRHD